MQVTNNYAGEADRLLRALADVIGEAVAKRLEPAGHTEPEPPRILLTVGDAAQRLSIGRTHMYRLLNSGEVESVRIGRLRRVPATALEEYVRRLRLGTQQARQTS